MTADKKNSIFKNSVLKADFGVAGVPMLAQEALRVHTT